MGAKVTIHANVIRSNDGERTVIENIAAYDSAPALASLLGADLICKDNLTEAVPYIAPILTFDLDTTESAPYTLTSPQLASVNDFGKYPSFVAIISGEPFTDIQPIYTGSPGSFTQVQIKLHDDGTGTNLDDTTVQFS